MRSCDQIQPPTLLLLKLHVAPALWLVHSYLILWRPNKVVGLLVGRILFIWELVGGGVARMFHTLASKLPVATNLKATRSLQPVASP